MNPNNLTESAQTFVSDHFRYDLPEAGMTGILSHRLPTAISRWCTNSFECDHSSRGQDHEVFRLSTGLVTLWYQHLACDSTKRTVRGRIVVSGAWPHAVKLPLQGVHRSEAILIRPGAARAIFGLPASELACRRMTLEDLLPGEGTRLEQRILDENCKAAPQAVLTEWIGQRIQQHGRSADLELVEGIRAWIGTNGHHRDISAIAGGSQRSLQRWFSDCVGLAPRDLGRLWQVGRAVREAMTAKSFAWTDLALRHGFYDQAHFVRCWSKVVGMPPTQLMRRWHDGGRWVQGMILLPP